MRLRIFQRIDRLKSLAWLGMTFGIAAGFCGPALASVNAVYQWSVPVAPSAETRDRPPARAYLWVPEHCQHVRAVVLGEHNMLEEDILDAPAFRRAMAEMNIAIVWVSPSMEFRVATPAAAHRFDVMLKDLATESGYSELAVAPLLPIGHSAHASFPWNFAAWEPQRTLGILSVHGDAPETPLAGFGPQRIRYPEGALDGVPGLMVMGEYEWIDARWAPATVYRTRWPKAPIAMLADIGQGHFVACDDLVDFLILFIRKCVEYRLPADTANGAAPLLKPIDPSAGWLVQRWPLRGLRTIEPAPAAGYGGNDVDAFWAFDREMAEAIQHYRENQTGKLPQLIGYQQGAAAEKMSSSLQMMSLKFAPADDGETFSVNPMFLSAVPSIGQGKDVPGKNNFMRWTDLPVGAPLGHADSPITMIRIDGPIEESGPNTFRLRFYRGSDFNHPVAWLAATNPGDAKYKSAVQQATLNIPRNTHGAEQAITFGPIADEAEGAVPMTLSATSSAGLPVRYFVRAGPAEIDDQTLKLLPIPPRAKLPVAVTIVAWQWGRSGRRPVQSATPIEQTFHITAAEPSAKKS